MEKIIFIIFGVIIVLAAAILAYVYWPKAQPISNVPVNQQEQTTTAQPQKEIIEPIIPATKDPSFTICSWQCGDGVCQKTQVAACKNGENCVCLEAPENCPEDCH